MENQNFENPEAKDVEAEVNRIKELSRKLISSEEGPDLYSKLAVFVDKLLEKGYNVDEYAFYHAASGNTPPKPWSEFPEDRIDFPGDDSIENFLKKLERGE